VDPVTWAAKGLGEIGAAVWLLVQAARGAVLDLLNPEALSRRRLADALTTYVWRPLPVLIALAVLAGLIAGLLASRILKLYNAELAVAPGLARSLAGDIAPLLIGVFAAGRVSVDVAARLGGMRLNRELEALEALGHDTARYTLAPPLAAVVAATPIHLLTVLACAWLAAGGALQIHAVLPWSRFVGLTLDEAFARAALRGMAKTLVYMLIAVGVGAAAGSREARGVAQIGNQATAAFTGGLLAVFAAAVLWTAVG
jgi:phospholipid/cholesterol/gamma-HCH transport system permease protein